MDSIDICAAVSQEGEDEADFHTMVPDGYYSYCMNTKSASLETHLNGTLVKRVGGNLGSWETVVDIMEEDDHYQ